MMVPSSAVSVAAIPAVRPNENSPPRHPTQFGPIFLGILRRGMQSGAFDVGSNGILCRGQMNVTL